MEEQIRAMKARLAEIETLAKNDNLVALEKKIDILEKQVEDDMRTSIRAESCLERSERNIRELSYQNTEDRKDYAFLGSVVNQLSNVIEGYKGRVDMVHKIADTNLELYQETERRLAAARERAAKAEEELKKLQAASSDTKN